MLWRGRDLSVHALDLKRRPSEGPSEIVTVNGPNGRRVEVCVSPGGKSMRIWVDGSEIERA